MVEADNSQEEQQFQQEEAKNGQQPSQVLFNQSQEQEEEEVQPSSFFSQVPFSSQQLLNGRIGPDDDGEDQNLELFQMITLLHNEKMAPELLPFQFNLVDKVLRMISSREQLIDSKRQVDQDDRFTVNIYKMEVERVKFVMKSYLRTRLAKIERHLVYFIEKDRSELMSEAEQLFAFQLLEGRKSHFKTTFFKKVPHELNVLEQEPVPDRVVTQPNLNEFVFVRMLIGIDSISLMEGIDVQLLQNEVYFLPYECIKTFVQEGKAELM